MLGPSRWLPVVAVLTVCLLAGCSKPVEHVLTYEFASGVDDQGEDIDPADWRRTIDHRVNVDGLISKVSVQPNGRFVIEVYANRPVERVKWRLAQQGDLEVRILAHAQVHTKLIAQAQAEPGGELRDASGEVIGRWVPLAVDAEGRPWVELPDSAVARAGPDGSLEVLVAIDDKDITEQDIVKMLFSTDAQQRHAVRYYLNPAAAIRMRTLSRLNLPSENSPQVRQVAHVLEGRIWSVQPLTEEWVDTGSIQGDFGLDLVRDLIAVYGYNNYDRIQPGGRFPAPLVLVDEQQIE